jgi:hypothetical protein
VSVLRLPTSSGDLERYQPLATAPSWPAPAGPPRTRTAYAAAHVVAHPSGETVPGGTARLDWEATLAFRRHLWSYGFGVAEAMDTAQRGMGLDWPATTELIARSADEARAVGGEIVVGVATDHLEQPPGAADLDAVLKAYLTQLELAERAGARAVLMCSRHLVAAAKDADDYRSLYGELLRQASEPVVLHWLGTAFDPALAGYWGSTDLDDATTTLLGIIAEHPAAVDGVKISLLDADREIALRRALPAGVRLYTGDDFHYPELILGDDQGFSHALLGVFDAIAPAAAAALHALDRDDVDAYASAMAATLPLARHLFAAPTYYYKTGLTFLAWLAGRQNGFTMLGGLAAARSAVHLSEVYRLADAAGLLPDTELATRRMQAFLTVVGVDR